MSSIDVHMFFSYAVSLALAAGGVAIIVWTCIQSFAAWQSKKWRDTAGTVATARVKDKPGGEGYTFYRLLLRYEYEVNGQLFVGERAQFGDDMWTSWRSTANRLMRQVPVGSVVKVHYDPSNPAQSVLQPGPSGFLIFQLVMGIGFLIAGILAARAV